MCFLCVYYVYYVYMGQVPEIKLMYDVCMYSLNSYKPIMCLIFKRQPRSVIERSRRVAKCIPRAKFVYFFLREDHGRQRQWNIGGSQVERRRREN